MGFGNRPADGARTGSKDAGAAGKADITYIPMAPGFLYLVAIMDWHSRQVVAWKLSNTMDTDFCGRRWRKH